MSSNDPWLQMSVLGPEDNDDDGRGIGGHGGEERTPLNSAANSPDKVGRRSSKSPSPIDTTKRRAQREIGVARNEAQAYAEEKDQRKSATTSVALGLFILSPLLDVMLLYDFAQDDLSRKAIEFGQSARAIARGAQIVATCFTLLLGLYSITILRRWQMATPRFAAASATQFALLPEYKVISLVLDVGKLAYPAGYRVPITAMIMSVHVLEIVLLLRLTLIGRLHRELLVARQLPEMLRTLVSLEGVESRGLGDVAPQLERPLTVDLLEKLIVFLTPRRLGAKPPEGAGLSRNSALPLTSFVFIITAVAAFVDFNVLFSSQEPAIDAATAATMAEASRNETARLVWRLPDERAPPPVTVILLVISGVTADAGSRILAPAFDRNANPLCALDITTRCDTFTLKSVIPSTSLPNWIASVTGTTPSTHGVLGNIPLGSFPFDSVFGEAESHGVHAGISASPWCDPHARPSPSPAPVQPVPSPPSRSPDPSQPRPPPYPASHSQPTSAASPSSLSFTGTSTQSSPTCPSSRATGASRPRPTASTRPRARRTLSTRTCAAARPCSAPLPPTGRRSRPMAPTLPTARPCSTSGSPRGTTSSWRT